MSSTCCNEDIAGWRNLNFFRDVVSQDLRLPEEEFRLCNFDVTATDKQAGFTSLLHRVKVDVELKDGKCEQRSYIVKETSKEAYGGETEDTYHLFRKEIDAYKELIPEFEKLFHHKVKFGPRFFKSFSTNFTVIVMEDLNESGYVMNCCSKRLGMVQSKQVFSRLAKFHAASAVYFNQNGPYSKSFKAGIYDEDSVEDSEVHIGNLFKSLIKSLKERNCSSQFLDLMDQWDTKPYVVGVRLFNLNDDEFNVLNHGDLWMNNMMFSNNDMLLVQLIYNPLPTVQIQYANFLFQIDFQLAFYGTFAFDILHFIFCTVEIDDIINRFDDLIEFYHQELRTAFQMLDKSSMLPSLEKLHAGIKKHGFLAALLMIDAIPIFSYIKVGELSMDLMSSLEPEGVEVRRKIFHNEKFIEVVDRLLPFLFEQGYLKCPNDL